MMVEYRIDSRKRSDYILYPLFKLLAAFAVCVLIGIVLFKVESNEILIIVLGTGLWFSVVHLLPLFFIATRHLKINKNAVFYVDKANGKFQYRDDRLDFPFELNQIEKIICVVSPSKYDKRLDFLGFGHFFYWKIVFIKGLTLQLSCMLVDDEVHFGKPIEHEKKVFTMPSFKYRSAAKYS